MNAIGLNPIKLDAIGLDPIRMNAIRLGVLGASSDSGRPYIDPELLSHVKMAISTWGKTNDDPDRAVLKDLSGNGNDMRLLNFGFAEGSGYGLPGTDFEGWLCTDGVDDIIVSVKPVSEMLEGSNEFTVISIIHYINVNSGIATVSNNFIGDLGGKGVYARNSFSASETNKTGIYGYTYNIPDRRKTVIGILGDEKDYAITDGINVNCIDEFTVNGFRYSDLSIKEVTQIAYAGGFIANKVLTTDEINQVIAYYNLDRPGQIIKPQLYCNIKKQGITNDNHAKFNDQLIDFINGHNIQLNNVGWEGESGIIDGALYLDGINDFGKVTGLPVVKDYTVAALRKWLSPKGDGGGLVSKSKVVNNGAFMIEQAVFNAASGIHTYSFGLNNTGLSNPDLFNKSYVYQTKYSYNGNPIQAGTGVDGDSMWLGTLRDNDTRFAKLALWSLMLFPYSLSEFLLERQLRKYKAGTLYPDMVEFRPIVKSNIPYSSISYSVNPGVYVTEGSTVTITITLSNASDKLVGVSSNAISDISISGDNGTYEITGKVTKSPQKISIVISSYLTMLGND
ncbi:hypothetical protein AAH084_22245, partial [Bacteroides faecis]|uniref:hypothetical protein n=1 Tax=Bacteroides faecis TaxID=674529 RepID=UPI0039B48250